MKMNKRLSWQVQKGAEDLDNVKQYFIIKVAYNYKSLENNTNIMSNNFDYKPTVNHEENLHIYILKSTFPC